MKKPVTVKILIILIVFQALSGLFGGAGLIIDSSGKFLNIPLEWLEGSPLSDYFIPGIILFAVLGIFPSIVIIGLLKSKYWGWIGSVLLGIALIIWIIVEIIIIGYQADPPLQLIYGILGVIILSLCFLPNIRRYYLKSS
jgi:hypothetical protein